MKIKQILLSITLIISAAYAQKNVEYRMPAPGDDVIGEVIYVTPQKHESLADLAIRYEMGYEELKWANPGINPWMLSDQRPLALPLQFILPEGKRSGIVSNIPEMRTYYFLKDSDKIYVYPVGVGRMDWKTPLGSWSVTRKQENPAWYPPASIRREHEEMGRGTLPGVVPPGPDNPLGTRVLRLSLPSYLLHGTNEQTGIGMRVTHGCMRFYPQHIEHLYEMVPTNTVVTFLNEPVKYGFLGNDLLIEVHPPLEEDNLSLADLKNKALTKLERYLKEHPNTSVNYDLVNLAVEQQSGIPIIVGYKTDGQRHRATPSDYYESHQNEALAPIELYSTSESYQAPTQTPTITAPKSKMPPARQSINHKAPKMQDSEVLQLPPGYKANNADIQVIKKEIRLTPDPHTTMPINLPDHEIIFPDPTSPRR